MNPHIIFVFPPAASSSNEYVSAHFNMCLGSAYTISYLVQKGLIARPFLTNEPINVSECAAQILSKKPKVVGFTVYDSNYCLCQLIAHALKEADPNIIILFGGPTASVQAEAILKNNDFVDICVRHEGEETCLELLSVMDNVNFDLKKALAFFEKIKGITFRTADHIQENPGRNILLENGKIPDFLDKYPSPYLSGVLDSAKPGIITARGCNQHCVYCNCAVMSKRIIATHSIDRVIRELDYISKKFDHNNGNNVIIYDDAFTLMPERALEICHRIIENKIKLPLVSVTRCDKVNEELIDTMKEAGFISIGFSLESAVPHILRKIGKVQHPNTKTDDNFEKEKEFIEKFKKYTSYAKKIGIEHIFSSIMLGLPGETLEEGQQTVNLIHSLEEKIDYYAHNIFKIYPGTPIFHNYEKYDMKLLMYDNQVHSRTIHTYDTCKIPLAPKSNMGVDTVNEDKVNIKTLALSPSKKTNFNYFNKIILCADMITGELILWLKKYLAVNGPIIQIYSNFDRAKQYHEDNKHALRKYMSPTTSHVGYYQTDIEDGVITLTPLRMHFLGKQCGVTIDLVKTGSGLSSSPAQVNRLQTICIDREKEDVLQLHQLLVRLSNKENTFNDLVDTPIFPYIGSLCRWEKSSANCRTSGTVIIDADNNVKTCWHGNAVGKVGMPFPGILENLKNIHRATENKRGCMNCNKQAECTKCIFPGPLFDKEYCDLKRNFNTGETAELIRAFDFFKVL
ncbi:MAG: radical SAM protein [Candidatus Aminicenantes bacterium]|nr:MAG: radical SAM protein [Candidatus Aminicenantes bacterium]